MLHQIFKMEMKMYVMIKQEEKQKMFDFLLMKNKLTDQILLQENSL